MFMYRFTPQGHESIHFVLGFHSGKKKLNEPRECLFKGLRSKLLVQKYSTFIYQSVVRKQANMPYTSEVYRFTLVK